jgi:UPF0755 protein
MSGTRVRRVLAGILLVAGLAVLGAGLAARAAWRDLFGPWAAFPAPGVTVEVPEGAGGAEIARALEEAGVVPSADLLRAWLRWTGLGAGLRAGEYRFEGASSPVEVLRKVLRGEVVLHTVTVPEGLTAEETARLLAASGHWTEREAREALAHPEWVRDLDPRALDLEGYLFPDTYAFARGAPAEDVVRAMLERFGQVYGPAERRRAAFLGMGTREVVTLASLVEREARLPQERPVVSSVIHNRLRRGMRLEVDPTVIYALRRAGRRVAALTLDDLRFEDPYNTYLREGLPPGPICSPGRASLAAALWPAETDYLYFVVDPSREGGHRFSRTLSEHSRAVRDYRRNAGPGAGR